MADSLYTSDRLCKVITQNFREDRELVMKLKALEVKRRQAVVRVILKTLEIERDIGGLLLPELNQKHIRSNNNKKRELFAKTISKNSDQMDRLDINEQSYRALISRPGRGTMHTRGLASRSSGRRCPGCFRSTPLPAIRNEGLQRKKTAIIRTTESLKPEL